MKILDTITPLRMIFWGALLCIFDLTLTHSVSVNGNAARGFRLDILNDFIGATLIAVAVFRLSNARVRPPYPAIMSFLKIVAPLCMVEALIGHFIFPPSLITGLLATAFGFTKLLATILFCVAMILLCQSNSMTRARESWLVTLNLMIFLWVIPVGLFYCLGIVGLVSGKPVTISGILVVATLLVMVVALVHFFVSTSRMSRDAQSMSSMLGPPAKPTP